MRKSQEKLNRAGLSWEAVYRKGLVRDAMVRLVGVVGNALALSIMSSLGGDRADDAVAPHRHRGRVAERLMGTPGSNSPVVDIEPSAQSPARACTAPRVDLD